MTIPLHMTPHQWASYLAGMLDYSSSFETRLKPKLKIRLRISSWSKNQMVAFQRAFGGEIKGHRNESYRITLMKSQTTQVLSVAAPFMSVSREALAKQCQLMGLELPPLEQPDLDFYIGGVIDAKESFSYAHYAGKDYEKFSLSCYSGRDREYLLPNSSQGRDNNQVSFTVTATRKLLERIRPFVLEYEKYSATIYGHIAHSFDSSILSSKTEEYYLAEQEKARQKAAQEKIDHEAAKAKKKLDRQHAILNGRITARYAKDSFRYLSNAFLDEMEETEKYEDWYDLAYHRQYRSRKTCRICHAKKLVEEFDKAHHPDGLKHECKRCHYEIYVKPKLHVLKERTKQWQKDNPEKTKAAQKKQSQKPQVRIRGSLGNRVKKILGKKSEKYCELIGCSPARLTAHLESLFQPGMTWDNYGEWHVDHKLPCRSFDLTDKAQRLECFNYTNLQPLWAEDNMKKADTLPNGEKARRAARAA